MTYLDDIRAARNTLAVFALMGWLWGGFHAYAPATKAGAGAGDAGFGLALFASAVGSLAAMTLAPRVERWLGARSLVATGLFMLVAFQLMPFATDLTRFIVVMLVVGASLGLMDVLMNAQVARDEAHSGRSLMNLNHGAYSLAYTCAALTAAPLRAAEIGLPVFYAVTLALGLVLLWPVRRVALDDPGHGADGEGGGRLPAVALWGGAIVLIAFACENAVEAWSALHVERTLGGMPAQGALGPAALGLTMTIGRLGAQALATRGREPRLILIAALIAAAGSGVAALAGTPGAAYLGFAAAGLGLSVLAPMALALIGRVTLPAQRTRAVARGAVIGYLGFFFGPPLVGMIVELMGLRAAFVLVALALLAIPLVLGRIRSA